MKKSNILIFLLLIIALIPTDIFASKTKVDKKTFYASGTSYVCVNGLACTTLNFSGFGKTDTKSSSVNISSSNSTIASDSVAYTTVYRLDGYSIGKYRYLNFNIYVTIPPGYRLAELERYARWRYIDETYARPLISAGAGTCQSYYHQEVVHVGWNLGSIGLFGRIPDTGGKTYYRYNHETLYIGMYPNTTTVYYNANGGTGAPGPTWHQYASTSYITGTVPVRTGYVFGGWNKNANGTGTNYNSSQDVTYAFPSESTLTLYAKWVPYTYRIQFDGNGGRGTMEDQVFTYDISQKLRPNEYDRPNYKFIEWNTEPDGTGTSYTSNQEILNLTATNNAKIRLYAQWVEDVPLIITDDGEEVEKDNSGNYVLKNKRSTGKLKICKDIIQG